MKLVRWAVISLVLTLGLARAQSTSSPSTRLAGMGIAQTSASLVQYAGLGDLAMFDLLVAAGVAVTQAEPNRQATALHAAAAQGHARIVERLINLGADVNASDWRGATPLVVASSSGHLAIVRTLLGAGARVDAVPKEAPTALIAAIQNGNAQVVDELLRAGASGQQTDSFGTTPFQAARRAGRRNFADRLEAAK